MSKRKPRPSPWSNEPPKVELPPDDPSKRVIGDARDLAPLFPKQEGKSFKSFWSSPEKFASVVEQIDKNSAWNNGAWEPGEWSGSKDMKEALDLARYGWKEGIEKASRLLGRIQAKYPIRKMPVVYSPIGVLPSVPRAVAGNPNNMRMPDAARSKRRPVLTIVSDTCANCGHKETEFINRAAVVAAIIDQVEAQGYSCDVLVYAMTRGNKMTAESSCMVKNSNQPVDIARLSYGLGHPAMFRRLIFAEWGGDSWNKDIGWGLGHVAIPPIKDLNEEGLYVIPSVNYTSCFQTEELAETEGLKYIIESLQSQRFPPFEGLKLFESSAGHRGEQPDETDEDSFDLC